MEYTVYVDACGSMWKPVQVCALGVPTHGIQEGLCIPVAACASWRLTHEGQWPCEEAAQELSCPFEPTVVFLAPAPPQGVAIQPSPSCHRTLEGAEVQGAAGPGV